MKIIVKNKRASYDYELLERFEAGLMLTGTEIKSLRMGKVTIAESHVSIDALGGEVWIHNMNIAHYTFGNIHNHNETRKRKLLLNRTEIDKLYHRIKSEGLTVVPTILYFKKSLAKVEIALGKGKKRHDKRQDLAKKDAQKKIRGALKKALN